MNTSKRVYKIAAVVAVTILLAIGFSLILDFLFPPHRISWHGIFLHSLRITVLGLLLGWFGNQAQNFLQIK